MSILIDRKTKVVVQGITGRDGSFHTKQMIQYGTQVVSGVTPGKAGETFHGVPVYNTVAEAVDRTGANTSVIYVPPPFAADAVYEAADAGIDLVVCITEGIPTNDVVKIYRYLEGTKTRLLGPNCPGLISPGLSKVGILPGHIHKAGKVGVISRSGTLTYEVVYALTVAGIGQSTCIGIGGDQVIGTNFIDCLAMFEADPKTDAIVLIGEIGGSDEEEAAEFYRRNVTKPLVAFIAGLTAPPGKRMGHAGAIISGGSGTAEDKIAAFEDVRVPVADRPGVIPELVAQKLAHLKGKRTISVSRTMGARKSSSSRTIKPASSRRSMAAKKRKTVSKAAAGKKRVISRGRSKTRKPARKGATKRKSTATRKKATTSAARAKPKASKKRVTRRTATKATKRPAKKAGKKKARKKATKKSSKKRGGASSRKKTKGPAKRKRVKKPTQKSPRKPRTKKPPRTKASKRPTVGRKKTKRKKK